MLPDPPPPPRRPRPRADPGRLRADRPLQQPAPNSDRRLDVDERDPVDHGDRDQRRPRPGARRHDPEWGAGSPEDPGCGRGQPTPQAALERYANLDMNWTAKTVADVQNQLAAISVGEARAQALQAAASYGQDTTLQASRVANTGTVVAIAPGQGSAAGWWVVVTRESTTGQGDYAGLPPTDHVTDAQLEHTATGWVISSWSPQS